MLYILESSKFEKFKDKIVMIITLLPFVYFFFFFPGENCQSLGLAEEIH